MISSSPISAPFSPIHPRSLIETFSEIEPFSRVTNWPSENSDLNRYDPQVQAASDVISRSASFTAPTGVTTIDWIRQFPPSYYRSDSISNYTTEVANFFEIPESLEFKTNLDRIAFGQRIYHRLSAINAEISEAISQESTPENTLMLRRQYALVLKILSELMTFYGIFNNKWHPRLIDIPLFDTIDRCDFPLSEASHHNTPEFNGPLTVGKQQIKAAKLNGHDLWFIHRWVDEDGMLSDELGRGLKKRARVVWYDNQKKALLKNNTIRSLTQYLQAFQEIDITTNIAPELFGTPHWHEGTFMYLGQSRQCHRRRHPKLHPEIQLKVAILSPCMTDLFDYIIDNITDIHEIVSMFRKAAIALKRCHDQGAVHNDVKSENFLIDSDQNIWLCDFEFSYFEALEMADNYAISGTFLSPEKTIGQPADSIQDRQKSDVWSLGISLLKHLINVLLKMSRSHSGSETISPLQIKIRMDEWLYSTALKFRQGLQYAYPDGDDIKTLHTFINTLFFSIDAVDNRFKNLGNLLRETLAISIDDRLSVDEFINHPYFAHPIQKSPIASPLWQRVGQILTSIIAPPFRFFGGSGFQKPVSRNR